MSLRVLNFLLIVKHEASSNELFSIKMM